MSKFPIAVAKSKCIVNEWQMFPEEYSEPCQTTKMKCFAKTVNG